MTESAIQIRHLDVRYDDATALSGVDLDVPAGSSLAVIGPNGSGKSTLLGAIAGTLEPFAGTITIPGTGPALVLQSTEVDPGLPITVVDAVSLGRYSTLGLLRRFGQKDRTAVEEAMQRLSISEFALRQMRELSGGQRQRVLVAQGLAQDTGVLLLDEPITGLDVPSRAAILQVIDEEVAAGKAVVMTTHDLDDARRCDQVLLLDREPIAVGTPDEVLTEDNLKRAFGGRFTKVGDQLILDDPHHHH